MNFRAITTALLVSSWGCPFAFGADQNDVPAKGGTVPDAIDRGMLLDASQIQKRLAPTFDSTTTTGGTLQDGDGPLKLTRRQQTMNRPGWPFQTNGEIFSSPCFDDKCMYFGACDGIFYCLDKKTAVIRWRKEGFERVDSAPALHEGTVFFTGFVDTLYAMKSDSGEAKWNAKAPGIGGQNPKLLNKAVYVVGEGQLLGFDPRNGKALRRHAFLGSGGDFAWNSKAIVVAVYKDLESKNFTGKGSVVCFARDSAEPRWTTVLGGACLGTLVCDENNCYLGARDGFFYAIRLTDGKIIWRIDCRRLFSGSGSENRLPQPASGNEKGPVWADEYAIDEGAHVAFSAGHQLINAPSVIALAEKKTGKLVWAVPHPARICGRFLAADGILAAMAEDREMLLVRIADGKSVHCSPLPTVLGEGFNAGQPRGEFAGISLDQGELFIVGADKHVWRLPLDSVKGKLNWPVAQPANTPPQSGSSHGGEPMADEEPIISLPTEEDWQTWKRQRGHNKESTLPSSTRSEPPSAGDELLPKDVGFDRDTKPLDVALIRAAIRGDMPGVEHIVQTHPEVINAQPSVGFKGLQSHCDQWSALHWAVARNDRTMVEYLVKHGADPNGKVKCERPLLGMAKSERLARILIDAGADVNAAGWDGEKPLHDTIDGAIARLLIAKGAKIDDPNNEVTKDTPLHCAARYDRLDVARVLVEHKANVNAKNCKGIMPLHDACHTGDLTLVTLLIEHGADVRGADQDGTTPVMCAARGWGWKNQSVDILQLLAKHGASLATKTKSGETLLHLAAQSHLVDAAKFLLETGLDVNARTENGVTALHCAAQGYATSDIDIVKLLLEHGANVNAVAMATVEESTPSQTAYVTKKITPLGYAMSVKHFAPIQTDIPGVWESAEENVKQINRTRKSIADLLRRHGAK